MNLKSSLWLVVSSKLSTFAQDALWLRHPALSPDGKTLLLAKGDIYVVNAQVALQFLLPFMKDMT
jgi:hypothetical protein